MPPGYKMRNDGSIERRKETCIFFFLSMDRFTVTYGWYYNYKEMSQLVLVVCLFSTTDESQRKKDMASGESMKDEKILSTEQANFHW